MPTCCSESAWCAGNKLCSNSPWSYCWAHGIAHLPWPCSSEAIFKWEVTNFAVWLLFKPCDMLTQLPWPHSSFSSAACCGTALTCSAPFLPSSENSECHIDLAYLILWEHHPCCFQSQKEGGGKTSGPVPRYFIPVQLLIKETLRPYLQSGRPAPQRQLRTHA